MRIVLDDCPRFLNQVFRLLHLILDELLQPDFYIVGVVQVEVQFLLRQLHLQVNLLLHMPRRPTIRNDCLHAHTNDEEYCRNYMNISISKHHFYSFSACGWVLRWRLAVSVSTAKRE